MEPRVSPCELGNRPEPIGEGPPVHRKHLGELNSPREHNPYHNDPLTGSKHGEGHRPTSWQTELRARSMTEEDHQAPKVDKVPLGTSRGSPESLRSEVGGLAEPGPVNLEQ